MRTYHPQTKPVAFQVGDAMGDQAWPLGTQVVLTEQDLQAIANDPPKAGAWLAELLRCYAP